MAICPSCVADEVKTVWGSRDEKSIFRCQCCALIFFDRGQFDDIPNNYQNYYPYLDLFNDNDFEYELAIRKHKLQKQLTEIQYYSNGGAELIDIGAGPGYLCHIAKEMGFAARGIEISQTAKKYGEKYFDVLYSDVSEIKEKSIDIIICNHVIEHIVWPRKFITELTGKLSKNGIISVQVPNQEPLTFYMKNIFGKANSKREKVVRCIIQTISLGSRCTLNQIF